jgi:hypothetical protein
MTTLLGRICARLRHWKSTRACEQDIVKQSLVCEVRRRYVCALSRSCPAQRHAEGGLEVLVLTDNAADLFASINLVSLAVIDPALSRWGSLLWIRQGRSVGDPADSG